MSKKERERLTILLPIVALVLSAVASIGYLVTKSTKDPKQPDRSMEIYLASQRQNKCTDKCNLLGKVGIIQFDESCKCFDSDPLQRAK